MLLQVPLFDSGKFAVGVSHCKESLELVDHAANTNQEKPSTLLPTTRKDRFKWIYKVG